MSNVKVYHIHVYTKMGDLETSLSILVTKEMSRIDIQCRLLLDAMTAVYVMSDYKTNFSRYEDYIRKMLVLHHTKTVDKIAIVLPFDTDENPYDIENFDESHPDGASVSFNWIRGNSEISFKAGNEVMECEFSNDEGDTAQHILARRAELNNLSKEELVDKLLRFEWDVTIL